MPPSRSSRLSFLFLALVACPTPSAAQGMVKALQLMDASTAEAYQLDDYLSERMACFDELNRELQALHVPSKYFMLGSQGAHNQFMSMPSLSELKLVRNATLRVFHIGPSTRASIIGCVERGECGWVFAHLDTLCHRKGSDVDALARAVADGEKLLSGVVRAVSAFILPDAPPSSPPSQQRRATAESGVPWAIPPVSLLGLAPPTASSMSILGVDRSDASTMTARALGYAGDVVSSVAERVLSGRRLSLWNHPVAPSLPIRTGQFDLKDFFASLSAQHADFDAAAAESVVRRMETDALNYAMKAYAELPMDMKMVAMAAVTDQASRFKIVQYLKSTRLLESGVRQFGASEEELRALRAYAAGDDARFDVVAEVFMRRIPRLDSAERTALSLMMRETAPVLRMNSAAISWLYGRYD